LGTYNYCSCDFCYNS